MYNKPTFVLPEVELWYCFIKAVVSVRVKEITMARGYMFCGLADCLDHCHLSWNLGVGISEGCFIFDFASLPLEVARPI